MEEMEDQAKSEKTVDEILESPIEEVGIDPWSEIYKFIDNDEDIEKKTDVMYIPGVGCIIRSIIMFEGELTSSQVFVPGVKLESGKVVRDVKE